MRRRRRISENETVIRINIERLKEGAYLAQSPDVPGLVAQGRTIAEVIEIAQDVARRIVESCLEHGDPLPPAFSRPPRRLTPVRVPVGIPALTD